MQYCLLDLIRLSVLMVLICGSTNTFDPYCARISSTSSRHFSRVYYNYPGSTAPSLPSTLETWGRLVSSMYQIFKIIQKAKIGPLIDSSQSAFMQGRYIFDTVVLAQEMVPACSRHSWHAFFLKLDFAKTFDALDQNFLLKVLRVRGFGERWCSWLSNSLQLGCLCPGKWRVAQSLQICWWHLTPSTRSNFHTEHQNSHILPWAYLWPFH